MVSQGSQVLPESISGKLGVTYKTTFLFTKRLGLNGSES